MSSDITDPQLENALLRLQGSIARRASENQAFLATLPQNSPCPKHADQVRQRDDQQSCYERRAMYSPCPLCIADRKLQDEAERLQRMGVPANLHRATFENWRPADEQGEAILAETRRFAATHRGFLVLLGDLGTGKTHLAVAVLRMFKSGLLIKQSELLRRLRQTYRDKAAVDPVDEAQSAGCLVMDEVGISPGGRDELPLLHDVLDHRHGNFLPTIITSNLSLDGLRDAIGCRMADRLKESAFSVLQFGGQSNRREARARYFED